MRQQTLIIITFQVQDLCAYMNTVIKNGITNTYLKLIPPYILNIIWDFTEGDPTSIKIFLKVVGNDTENVFIALLKSSQQTKHGDK